MKFLQRSFQYLLFLFSFSLSCNKKTALNSDQNSHVLFSDSKFETLLLADVFEIRNGPKSLYAGEEVRWIGVCYYISEIPIKKRKQFDSKKEQSRILLRSLPGFQDLVSKRKSLDQSAFESQFAESKVEASVEALQTLQLHSNPRPLLTRPDNFPMNPVSLSRFANKLFGQEIEKLLNARSVEARFEMDIAKFDGFIPGITSSLLGVGIAVTGATFGPLGLALGSSFGGLVLFTGVKGNMETSRLAKSVNESMSMSQSVANLANVIRTSLLQDQLFKNEIVKMNDIGLVKSWKGRSFTTAAETFFKGYMSVSKGERFVMGLPPDAHPADVDLATRITALGDLQKSNDPKSKGNVFSEIDYFETEPCPTTPKIFADGLTAY